MKEIKIDKTYKWIRTKMKWKRNVKLRRQTRQGFGSVKKKVSFSNAQF